MRLPAPHLLLAWLLVAACASPIKTAHDSDPSADFSKYTTYAWISNEPLIKPRPGVGKLYVSPIDEQRIRRAVDFQLGSKGYREVSLPEAGLVVSFTIGTQDKIRVTDSPGMGTVYTRGRRYGGAWYAGSPVRVQHYTEGTLALEFFDRESKQGVWVGWASKRLSERDDPDAVINEAVAKILEPFPARR